LGIATLAGVGVMILLIPINIRITRILINYQKELMAKKDIRIKLTNEILQGIQDKDNILKLVVFVSHIIIHFLCFDL
jgi:hypothetical protein